MKRIFSLFLAIVMIFALTACGNGNNKGESATGSGQEENLTDKQKYKKINADTTPIGVSNISFSEENKYNDWDNCYEWYTYLNCTVHKNDSIVAESIITVTFEVFDENGEFKGEEKVETSRSLVEGDMENLSTYLYSADKETGADVLAKWTANVIKIEELDAKEQKKQEELAKTINEIEWKVKYEEEYNTALTMLEIAKEEYPDSKELKLLEAELKDIFATKGIPFPDDGNSTNGEVNPVADNSMKTYVSTKGYEVDYPKTYAVTKLGNAIDFVITDDTSGSNVNIGTYENPGNIHMLTQESFESDMEAQGVMITVSSFTSTTINGMTAIKVVYDLYGNQVTQVIYDNGSYAHYATYTKMSGTSASVDSEMKKVVMSLKSSI